MTIWKKIASVFSAKSAAEPEPLPKEACLSFADLITSNDPEVHKELALYFDDREAYFAKYEFDLAQRGIENPEAIETVIALVDSLIREKYVVYLDWKTGLQHALPMLDDLSGEKLSQSDAFNNYFALHNTDTIAILDEEAGHELFHAIKTTGHCLLCINEGSDSYVLFLLALDKANKCIELAKTANIPLYYADKI